jgi:hypothetical protein
MTGPICSQCGYPLKLVDIVEPPGRAADPSDSSGTGPWFFAGAHFDCTHCGQQAHVRTDGSGTMTLATLHPKPSSAQDHHDYVDYWLSEKLMFLGMRCAAHFITRAEYEEIAAELKAKTAAYKAEHPLPMPFWRRLFAS